MNVNQLQILLADDDNDDCMLFKEALEELNVAINLTIVNDGQQLMQLLTKNLGNLPDVLFLDLNMPRKNGFVSLKEIKGNKELKHLLVFIFSTSCDEQNADLLYNLGAHSYICKPADFSQLKEVMAQALSFVMQENNTQPPKEKFIIQCKAHPF